jgi:hypothetical protein
MGQQQLLLLVLGILIVGLAVAVGIAGFKDNKLRVEQDMQAELALRVHGRITAWKAQPKSLGGGSEVSGLRDMTMAALGYDDTRILGHGQPAVWHPGIDYMTINAVNSSAPYLYIRGITTGSGSDAKNAITQSYFYGSSAECVRIRKGYAFRAGHGTVRLQWTTGVPSRPSNCSW